MERSNTSNSRDDTEASIEEVSTNNKPSEKTNIDSSHSQNSSKLITDEELQKPEKFAEKLLGRYDKLDVRLVELEANRNQLNACAMESKSGEEQRQQDTDMDTWSQDGNHSASSNDDGNDNNDAQ